MSACNTCTSGCCYRYIVPVTGYDMIKLKNMCMIEINNFVKIIPITTEEKLQYSQKHAALFKFTDDNCENFHIFRLRNAPSIFYPDFVKCTFLRELSDKDFDVKTGKGVISQCSIYNARPNTCVIYPATFDKDNKLALIKYYKDVKEKSCETTEENRLAPQLCPRQLTSDDFSHSKEDIIDALVQKNYELAFFKRMAEDWNANPKSQQEFFTFMEETYAQRVFSEADFR